MKGRNWRDYAPAQRQAKRKAKRRRRRRRGSPWRWLLLCVLLFCVGYGGVMAYYRMAKPYTVALDAGHGGTDVGAVGLIDEVELTERTVAELERLLREDGRFRVVLSREAGEGKSITERNQFFQKKKPDLVLSIHGNANDDSSASGFECYPSPPGYPNHAESLAFAELLAGEMSGVGARLRGTEGVRFGYYTADGERLLVDSDDTTVYDYDTFGILKNMDCPAVLAEQCFITNAADVEAFGTEEGCKTAAAAYYRAICTYLEQREA